MRKSKVALYGYGYWGKNLARCLNRLKVLKEIHDVDRSRCVEAALRYPKVEVYPRSRRSYDFSGVDSVVVATPPETHYEVAKKALQAGKATFVEKPLAVTAEQADELYNIAYHDRVPLMCGNIYLHNPIIRKWPIPIGRSEMYIKLLNPEGHPSGKPRDPLYAALPHALSLVIHFFSSDLEVGRYGASLRRKDLDRINLSVELLDKSEVHIDVGDFSGFRVRGVELRTGEGTYVYRGEETQPEALLQECIDFLHYDSIDLISVKVVRVLDKIRRSIEESEESSGSETLEKEGPPNTTGVVSHLPDLEVSPNE